MTDLFLLSERQMARTEPHCPLAHGVPRVDDRRVVSGIVYVIKHGLKWNDAPKEYGPHKTLYNRFIRWSRLTSSTASLWPSVRSDAAFACGNAAVQISADRNITKPAPRGMADDLGR